MLTPQSLPASKSSRTPRRRSRRRARCRLRPTSVTRSASTTVQTSLAGQWARTSSEAPSPLRTVTVLSLTTAGHTSPTRRTPSPASKSSPAPSSAAKAPSQPSRRASSPTASSPPSGRLSRARKCWPLMSERAKAYHIYQRGACGHLRQRDLWRSGWVQVGGRAALRAQGRVCVEVAV